MVIETYKKEIDIPTYVDKYVNVEEFLEKCKECPNYNQVWTCPPFDFSPEDYWKKYSTMELVAKKIILSPDERNGDWIAVLAKVKKELTAELFEMEKEFKGSISLSAGHCEQCEEVCNRKYNQPCCNKERMRYSIEALGGNVGLTIQNLMGLSLEWVTENEVPSYFILVGGILKK